mmetsp:Transcript_97118/g.258069  ORF Transcript_97118/g.258069 Transcript_97118/m.258069 type:complete len:207 (+) Transcript_97118:70-690(+)
MPQALTNTKRFRVAASSSARSAWIGVLSQTTLSTISFKSFSSRPPSDGAANVWMPTTRARSSSRTSSSTRRTCLSPSGPRWHRAPAQTRSSIKPAFPSSPIAFAMMGPLKWDARSASSRAPCMVDCELFEMMPRVTPASRSACKAGAIKSALSARLTRLSLRRAPPPPGMDVRVPSKSKRTTRTPPVMVLKSSRDGSGVDGVRSNL